MVTLLLGPDDFSKKEYVNALSACEKVQVEVLSSPESLPVSELVSQDLFPAKKIFVVNGGLKYLDEKNLGALIAGKNQILFLETKVDKRIKFNKDLLANKNIVVKEFILPRGSELDQWIIARVLLLGGKISPQAAGTLAQRLGRDNAKESKFGGKIVDIEEIYDLWQADSEIQKLIAYAGTGEISVSDVLALVSENVEVDVFDLTNAIADNQKQKALELLHGFLKDQAGSDEKGAIIQLNALLSEQFRNVYVVQDFLSRKTAETEILDKTGWKSGRLFVIKKIATKFPPKKVLELLNKLAALDEELKTSSTPPRVLLDLIVSQLLT